MNRGPSGSWAIGDDPAGLSAMMIILNDLALQMHENVKRYNDILRAIQIGPTPLEFITESHKAYTNILEMKRWLSDRISVEGASKFSPDELNKMNAILDMGNFFSILACQQLFGPETGTPEHRLSQMYTSMVNTSNSLTNLRLRLEAGPKELSEADVLHIRNGHLLYLATSPRILDLVVGVSSTLRSTVLDQLGDFIEVINAMSKACAKVEVDLNIAAQKPEWAYIWAFAEHGKLLISDEEEEEAFRISQLSDDETS